MFWFYFLHLSILSPIIYGIYYLVYVKNNSNFNVVLFFSIVFFAVAVVIVCSSLMHLNGWMRLRRYIYLCPNCTKAIILNDLQFHCPHCYALHNSTKEPLKALWSWAFRCSKCKEKVRSLKCPYDDCVYYPNKLMKATDKQYPADFFADYNEDDIRKKRNAY
jgi:hypothetical protein